MFIILSGRRKKYVSKLEVGEQQWETTSTLIIITESFFLAHTLYTELSLRAVTRNTCYGWTHLMLQLIKV